MFTEFFTEGFTGKDFIHSMCFGVIIALLLIILNELKKMNSYLIKGILLRDTNNA